MAYWSKTGKKRLSSPNILFSRWENEHGDFRWIVWGHVYGWTGMKAQTTSFIKHYSFHFPRLSLLVAICSCEQWPLSSLQGRCQMLRANTLSCGIQRELGTVEAQAAGLIELRKVDVVGELGQTFHLAGVRKWENVRYVQEEIHGQPSWI